METSATAQALDSHLATGDHIGQAAKVDLRVVINKWDLCWDLGVTCYIVTCLYRSYFLFVIALNTIVDWVEDNRENFSNSHLATALAHDVSNLLGRYLNACVRSLCTFGLKVPGSMKECILNHIVSELLSGPYQDVTCLPPSLKVLIDR